MSTVVLHEKGQLVIVNTEQMVTLRDHSEGSQLKLSNGETLIMDESRDQVLGLIIGDFVAYQRLDGSWMNEDPRFSQRNKRNIGVNISVERLFEFRIVAERGRSELPVLVRLFAVLAESDVHVVAFDKDSFFQLNFHCVSSSYFVCG